jgi:hypothetical protein
MAGLKKFAASSGSVLFRALLLLIVVVTMLAMFFSPPQLIHERLFVKDIISYQTPLQEEEPSLAPVQPKKIIGLVFYGRKEFVSVLDCYLKVSRARGSGSC